MNTWLLWRNKVSRKHFRVFCSPELYYYYCKTEQKPSIPALTRECWKRDGKFHIYREPSIFCLLYRHHRHLLTKINSTNNLRLRKVNALCTKSSILKKKTKKKEFIKDSFLNNLLKLFFHKGFYERTNYFDHFPLSSIYIWICKSL